MVNRLHPQYYVISTLSHQGDFSLPCTICCGHTQEGRDGPEGPEQAGEVGRCEPHEVQQGQVHSPAPGSGQFQAQIQAGGEWIERSFEEDR